VIDNKNFMLSQWEKMYFASIDAEELAETSTNRLTKKAYNKIAQRKDVIMLEACLTAFNLKQVVPDWVTERLGYAIRRTLETRGDIRLEDTLSISKKNFLPDSYLTIGGLAYELRNIHGYSRLETNQIVRYELEYGFKESQTDCDDNTIDKYYKIFDDGLYQHLKYSGYWTIFFDMIQKNSKNITTFEILLSCCKDLNIRKQLIDFRCTLIKEYVRRGNSSAQELSIDISFKSALYSETLKELERLARKMLEQKVQNRS